MGDPNAVEILLVEDNDEDAELTTRALKRFNLVERMKRVNDGAAALDFFFGPAASTAHPRVVLLDLKLPKIDGMEVLRSLKENEQTRCVPVVMLTSSKEDRDLERAYQLGVNSYIVKPVEFDAFVRVVEQLGTYWTLLNERR